MKIVVAGGAGFIGSHLCRRLVNEGHMVLCVDNMSTGDVGNVSDLMGNNFSILVQDVCSVGTLVADEVYNLACPASPKAYQADPVKTTKTAVLGTLHLLEMSRLVGARFLQASTSEVYGNPERHPQREDYFGSVNPVGVRSCYDEGKRCAESLCGDFARLGHVVRIARIFNTYGPGMGEDDGRVVSNFISQSLSGGPVTVFGDGSQTRSFCFVSDMVEGLIALMRSDLEGPVNLGNPDERTIKSVAELVQGDGGIEYRPLPEDDPVRRCPDISRARAIGWEPKVSFEDGLKETIEWFRSQSQT